MTERFGPGAPCMYCGHPLQYSPPSSSSLHTTASHLALCTAVHYSLAAEDELQIRGARMAASYSTARQGLLRALARSPKLGSPLPATAVRSLNSVQVPALQQQLQLRRETLSKSSQAWLVEPQQQMQQRRRFAAASGGEEDGSDDDFKPKRKAVPEGADEVSDLIKKQVRCGVSAVVGLHCLTARGVRAGKRTE